MRDIYRLFIEIAAVAMLWVSYSLFPCQGIHFQPAQQIQFPLKSKMQSSLFPLFPLLNEIRLGCVSIAIGYVYLGTCSWPGSFS